MKYLLIFLSLTFLLSVPVSTSAQMAAQKEAAYIATLKAVTDYKINDEENLEDMEKLRQDKRFNEKLQRMLNKLDNRRTKTGKNRRVYEILKRAGKEIYDELK